MPRTIRFHLDEHVSHAVAEGLQRLGVDVTTSSDAGLLGAEDADHLAFSLAEGRVIFSEDQDFLILVSTGVEHAGVAYCRQGSRSIGQIVRALELIWEVYEPNEMRNCVEFL
jgi:predicted nuclease of predicted toxin-antitoxin system